MVLLGPKFILILILIAISSLKCLRIFQVKKDPHKPNEFGPFGTKHYSFNLYDIHYIGISSMIYLKSFFEPKSEETSTLSYELFHRIGIFDIWWFDHFVTAELRYVCTGFRCCPIPTPPLKICMY